MRCRRFALVLSILSGCRSGGDEIQQVVRDTDGVEVVVVRKTPSIQDAWLATLHQASRAIETETASGDIRLFQPSAGALRGSFLVVADRADPPLVIFDRSNEVRSRIGQRGQGPGEIADPQPLVWWEGSDRVGVGDRANGRLLEFSLDGSLLSETKIDYSGFGFILNWDVDRKNHEIFAEVTSTSPTDGHRLVRIDRETGGLEPIVEFEPQVRDAPSARSRLWKRRALWAVLPGGLIVTGWTDDPVFSIRSGSGALLRKIQLPWAVRGVTREDVERVTEAIGDGFQPGERFPLTDQLVPVSDSTFATRHTWVANPESSDVLDGNSVAWSVFSVTGTPLGTVRFPPFYLPLMVNESKVLGIGRDSLGVARILVHELPF